MERSPEISGLIGALAKAQLTFTPALKDSSNPYFNSKYADLATVIDAVRPALNKNGIAILQFNSSDLEHQTASVTTSLHFGEQFISETMEAPAVGKSKEGKEKFDVQTLGAAWTYLRRYGIQSICGLASEDDDGNSLQNDNRPVQRKSKPMDPVASDDSPAQRGPTDVDFKMWQEAFQEAQTVEDWNTLIVPIAKERVNNPHYGRPFIVAMSEEAKRRGYIGDRSSGNYKVGPTTPPRYGPKQVEPTVDEYESGYQARGGQ